MASIRDYKYTDFPTGTQTWTVNPMPTHAAGDLLVVSYLDCATQGVQTLPAWTSLPGLTDGLYGTSDVGAHGFYKIAQSGSETAPSLTYLTTTSSGGIICIAIQNVDGTAPFDGINVVGTMVAGAPHTMSTITPNTNAFLVSIAAVDTSASAPGWWTGITSPLTVIDSHEVATTYAEIGLATGSGVAGVGYTGTWTCSGVDSSTMLIFAVRSSAATADTATIRVITSQRLV